nr:protein kinase-like domain-containing protein [Tanacetum cinerariifolium]
MEGTTAGGGVGRSRVNPRLTRATHICIASSTYIFTCHSFKMEGIGLLIRKKKKRKSAPSQSSGIENERFLKVSYNQLLKATDGFSKTNLIGEGGFSSVYKGILDSNNDKFVAVKVLHLQTRGAHKSFLAECEAWRNIRHRNLLKIITSCSSVDFQRKDFKALGYEFMPNGSVHDWLHSSTNTSKLNILQRINILRDVAAALDYLHIRRQTTIAHGDLKPSNILLDDDMVAHVGDFGLTRVLGTNLNQSNSTGVKGTIGYAPPEYGIGSEMTSSADVYSFRILLLELMTGKKPTDDMFNEGLSIHKFASMALPDHVVDVIDGDVSVLQSKEANAMKVEECLAATIKIGVSCSVDSPPRRMKIDIVVNELQSILEVLQNI